MEKQPIRWGFLGTGWVAGMFARDLLEHGFALHAVGSRSQVTADRFAAEFGVARAHPSYQALVDDPEIDIVYVATPHPFHAENALMALAAGKHVLVEKPFTLDAAEAHEVTELAAEKGLLVLEAMWTRFLPHMRRIAEIIRAGTIGELRSLVVDHTQLLSDDPEHRLNSLQLGGGALLDLGVYPISFASQLFGTPQHIVADASFRATGVDAQVATIFRYAGGQLATTYSASNTEGPNRAAILGDAGRIEIDEVWYEPATFRVYSASHELLETYTSSVVGRGMHYQAVEAEQLIRAGHTDSLIMPQAETVAIMQTIDRVRKQIGLHYPRG